MKRFSDIFIFAQWAFKMKKGLKLGIYPCFIPNIWKIPKKNRAPEQIVVISLGPRLYLGPCTL